MVEVTISTLVTQLPSEETYQEVKKLVLLQPEELVLSEVPERLSKKTNEEIKLELSILTLEHKRHTKQGFILQIHVLLFVLRSNAY